MLELENFSDATAIILKNVTIILGDPAIHALVIGITQRLSNLAEAFEKNS